MSLSNASTKNETVTPSLTIGPWQNPITVSGAPLDTTTLSLASLGNDLYLFGKGLGNYNFFWASTSNSTFSSIEEVNFSGNTIPGTQGPVTAAATSPTQLTVVWTGAPDDNTMWMSTFDSSSQNWIQNQTRLTIPPDYYVCNETGPALSSLNGEAYLLWAGGAKDGYFYTQSASPSSNLWQQQAKMGNTGPQNNFATPKLVPSGLDLQGSLLSLWAAPSENQVMYGTITPTSASVNGAISSPASAAPVFAAAAVPVPALGNRTAAVLLWSTGQYQVYTPAGWTPMQPAANNFQLPEKIAGFTACVVGNSLYVAWATPSSVVIQQATVTTQI